MICRPDLSAQQYLNAYHTWILAPDSQPIRETKIGLNQKISWSATDFYHVGPTFSKMPPRQSNFIELDPHETGFCYNCSWTTLNLHWLHLICITLYFCFQTDALTQQFGDLQGSHRELKLAAAHIDDALKGRYSLQKILAKLKHPSSLNHIVLNI